MKKRDEWVTAELRAAYEAGKQAARFDQPAAGGRVREMDAAAPRPGEKADDWHH